MRTVRALGRVLDPSTWGYRLMFQPGEHNRCPGCGHSNWHVGRSTAECAFCETALPIAAQDRKGFEQ